ncbi:5-methylcytosine-specific restriction protein A [Sphingomonas jinjuensis]|uniref:5-methylcytosine-specific restriction protein A n=1 Tax=Sphingomonas jinjuensis TaxID=535907 RepID=A0A840FAV9_9SPHN|nr:HNH endonuclease signature motif containing protein [Sphingomonas jinjuensis]MBB4152914.1 5-methylcytosine-specific restriction protein A [Sphingomonas jinjuensis]
MAWQPPALGGLKPSRAKWAPAISAPDRRKRGRAGQRERAQVVAEEPLCRTCLARGIETSTEEVDHIVPLAEGGSDTRSNKQGLCGPCHRAKTRREDAERRRGGKPDAA